MIERFESRDDIHAGDCVVVKVSAAASVHALFVVSVVDRASAYVASDAFTDVVVLTHDGSVFRLTTWKGDRTLVRVQ